MKKLLKYFIKGLLIFAPTTLTIFIVVWAFTSLDKIFRTLLTIRTPGLGLLTTLAIIVSIGYLASNYLGRKFFELIEKIFTHMPLVKLLYSAVKDMIEAFAGEKKSFNKPVLASISSNSSVKVLGFITRDSLENLGIEDYVAVYMPQSYNFAGNVLLFPKESVQPLDIESSEAMAFIVSGGLSGGSS